MKQVCALAGKQSKLVLGLMSGTSADGVDAALVRIEGCGLTSKIDVVAHTTAPYPDRLRERVLALGDADSGEICRLNFTLGEFFAAAGRRLVLEAGFELSDLDLVGSHGQTVRHVPRRPGETASTLQIGEADVIAERLATPVVADFRTRDIAAGGEGAPLSAYVDYLLFRGSRPPPALLNLGGIANVTVLGETIEEVFAFDTGPANMPLDEAVRILTEGKEQFDREGRLAARGKVDANLLARLLEHPYLKLRLPKTTGRETFGRRFVDPLLRGKGSQSGVDILATLTLFVARSIRAAFEDFVARRSAPAGLLVSGGGVHNLTLMRHLKKLFAPLPVRTLDDAGFDPDAKEAMIFAVLANETIHGRPNNVPGATGARWPTVLGKVSP